MRSPLHGRLAQRSPTNSPNPAQPDDPASVRTRAASVSAAPTSAATSAMPSTVHTRMHHSPVLQSASSDYGAPSSLPQFTTGRPPVPAPRADHIVPQSRLEDEAKLQSPDGAFANAHHMTRHISLEAAAASSLTLPSALPTLAHSKTVPTDLSTMRSDGNSHVRHESDSHLGLPSSARANLPSFQCTKTIEFGLTADGYAHINYPIASTPMATVQSKTGSAPAASSAAASSAAGVSVVASACISASSSPSDPPEISFLDGSTYRGTCSPNGKPQGVGWFRLPNGDVYEGRFTDGSVSGPGVYSGDDRRYEGEFVESEFSGLGAQWDATGKLIECGRWKDCNLVESCAVPLRCLPQGKHLSAAALKAKHDHPNDSALLPDGAHYIGQLNEQGRPHGQGASFHPDGSPIVALLIDAADASKNGRWVDGMLYGRASVLFANGNRYEGMFKDTNFDGLGVLSWKTGGQHEGEFVDEQCGLGAQWDRDGQLNVCGRWEKYKPVVSRAVPLRCLPEGKHLSAAALHAKAEHPNDSALFPDNTHYIGELNADGLPHGRGASFHPDGSPAITLLVDAADASNSARWINGKVQGRAVWIDSTGDRYEGMFKDSNCDGLGVFVWTADGSRYEGEFAAGNCSGLGAVWDADGELFMCARWEDCELVQPCAVPLRYFPEGKHLSAAALQAKRDHPNDSALFLDGTHYIGELNADGQPHGQGASFYPDGSPQSTLITDSEDPSSSGRWVEGRLQGRATMLLLSGGRYEGLFSNGRREGTGVFSRQDGRRYEGEFVAGKRSGLGVEWDKRSKFFQCGRWADDRFIQSCVVPLRLIPNGQWLSAAAQQAKRDLPDNSVLVPNGAHYIGELNEQGQPHGQGASFHSDGSLRVKLQVDPANLCNSGRFVDGNLQGRATVFLHNGDRYDGSFQGSARNDPAAVFDWNDGSRYEGAFAASKFHGFGVRWGNDGTVSECGRWEDDKLISPCPLPIRHILGGKYLSAAAQSARQSHPDTTLFLPSGGHYTGDFDAITLRLHGAGVEFDDSGAEIRRGEWFEGLFHSGSGVVVASDGSQFEGELHQNRPHGIGVHWSAQGAMIDCGEFVEGVLRRPCPVRCSQLPSRRFVAKDATLLFPDRRYYCGDINAADQRHGQGTLFSADKSAISAGHWIEDRLHTFGELAWSRGRVFRGHLFDELPNGLGQLRYPNGDLFEGEFVEGKKIGFGIKWNSKGKIIECGVYSEASTIGIRHQKIATGPVPRSQLLFGERLSEIARSASLLFPDGSCFVGSLNAQGRPHGAGKYYNALRVVTAAGLWNDGVIKQSAMVALRTPARQGGRRMALVIANTNYQSDEAESEGPESAEFLPTMLPPLGGTEDSGGSMIDCLLELGFDSVDSLYDGTLDQMRHKIRKLIDSLRAGDVVFLYFIGHGAMVNGTTYLAPVNLCGSLMTDFAISVQHIRDQISSSPNCKELTVVMALDCCRTRLSEPLLCSEDEDDGVPRGLLLRHEVSRSASVSCATSALSSTRESRDQRAARLAKSSIKVGNEYFIMHANECALPAHTLDGLGAFTRELLDWLPKRLEIKDMFRELSASLKRQTLHTEEPQLATAEDSLTRRVHLERKPIEQ